MLVFACCTAGHKNREQNSSHHVTKHADCLELDKRACVSSMALQVSNTLDKGDC